MASASGDAPKPVSTRLSPDVKPVHYSLFLIPCLETLAVTGQVDIYVDIQKETPEIKLHSDGNIIKKVDIRTSSQNFSGVRFELGNEIMTLTPPSPIPVGKATISIDFAGELRKDMKGFYRSVYKGEDGQERIMASTQFESTNARKAFPCFDEPAFKATFKVELVVDENLTALSNMNVNLSLPTIEDGFKTVSFATTPVMSTYLVAFAVGDLEHIETTTSGGTPVRVYTLPGKKAHGKFAMDLARKALEWYGEWFDIPYMLPKCDLLAVPESATGAMENWGLVIFRESVLLYDSARTSSEQKGHTALAVAHELAHFWFGNLVTMYWWNELWLKEGFACFMQYLFLSHVYFARNIWLGFARNEMRTSMKLDALRSSHPIEVQIDHPSDLESIYDSITYDKSNCMIRMLYEYLGEEKFQMGARLYLHLYSYENATKDDLWEALSVASEEDIANMMSGWTRQMGFPVITVREEMWEWGSRVIFLHQTRFMGDGSEDEKKSKWMVPITTLFGPSTRRGEKTILNEEEGQMTVTAEEHEYVKFNASTGGFYRVAYDGSMFDSLISSFHTLPPLDRFGFAADCFALTMAGRYSASHFLSLVASCSKETEFAVWGVLDDGLRSLLGVLEQAEPAIKRRLDTFVVATLLPILERVGWAHVDGEDTHRCQLRSMAINRLARSGHPETIQNALALFSSQNPDFDSDIRTELFEIAARNGTADHFAQLKHIYETCAFPEVERSSSSAMAQTLNVSQQVVFFRYAFEEGKMHMQDAAFALAVAATSREGQEFAWQYFKTEQPLIQAKLGGPQELLYQGTFEAVASGFCSEAKAKEVESFFRSCPSFSPEAVAALERSIKKVTELIRVNERLLSNNVDSINEFLSRNGY